MMHGVTTIHFTLNLTPILNRLDIRQMLLALIAYDCETEAYTAALQRYEGYSCTTRLVSVLVKCELRAGLLGFPISSPFQ